MNPDDSQNIDDGSRLQIMIGQCTLLPPFPRKIQGWIHGQSETLGDVPRWMTTPLTAVPKA